MPSRAMWVVSGVMIGALLLPAGALAQAAPSLARIDVRVVRVVNGGASLFVRARGRIEPEELAVTDNYEKSLVMNLEPGDVITADVLPVEKGSRILQQFSNKVRRFSLSTRLLIMILCAVILALASAGIVMQNPVHLVMGEDGRYSNSKFQMATWFFVLILAYVTTLCLRGWAGWNWGGFWGNIGIPQNLLILSGLSAFTFGAAKGITTHKVETEKAKDANSDPKKMNIVNRAAFFTNLVSNDNNQLDLGDFQMLIITLLAILVYLFSVISSQGIITLQHSVKIPDVDTTILSAFGLGQGAYLVKKAVGKAGES